MPSSVCVCMRAHVFYSCACMHICGWVHVRLPFLLPVCLSLSLCVSNSLLLLAFPSLARRFGALSASVCLQVQRLCWLLCLVSWRFRSLAGSSTASRRTTAPSMPSSASLQSPLSSGPSCCAEGLCGRVQATTKLRTPRQRAAGRELLAQAGTVPHRL